MQVTNLRLQPVWYFIFGPQQKSSLASQYALEHGLVHLVNPQESTLKEQPKQGLIIEGSAELFRKVQHWKLQLVAIFLKGDHSAQELAIKKDYQAIARIRNINDFSYQAFRKQIYPKIIILYGPSQQQNLQIVGRYFGRSGYIVVSSPTTANDVISKFPKTQNYVLLGFVPEAQQLQILESHCFIKLIHLKHKRVELPKHDEYFDKQAALLPILSQKPYFSSIQANKQFNGEVIRDIGAAVCPSLIFANVHDQDQRAAVQRYIQESDGLLINIFDIQPVLKRKPMKLPTQNMKIMALINIIFKNINRKQIFIQDFPFKPEEFLQLEQATRQLKVYADLTKAANYKPTNSITSTIYFLQTLKRRKIQLELPLGKQTEHHRKYVLVSGASCSGKTSASKFISSQFGYRHIEYDSYVASIKEKLIAPEDGEELPFHKITAHFHALIKAAGNTIILIDGLSLDSKDMQSWISINGPPTVINLKTDQQQLIKRTRKKNQADLAAEVTEEETTKAREGIAKNETFTDHLVQKSPLTLLYQVDFSQPLILAQELLKNILRPRVYLIQDNFSLLYQNLALKYDIAFFNLLRYPISEAVQLIKQGSYRDVILCNYAQNQDSLICQDFYHIEKNIGPIRYLSVWKAEDTQSKDQTMHLVPPPEPQKPKKPEGQEGQAEAPPEPEQEGQVKKKAINIYEHSWTKPGNHKNLSQWFFKEKKDIVSQQSVQSELIEKVFEESLTLLRQNKNKFIYQRIKETS